MCIPAPPGFFSPGGFSTDATGCTAGSFSPGHGAAACSPCPIGSFNPAARATVCEACPNNRLTPFVGAVSVEYCVSISSNYAVAFVALALCVAAYARHLYGDRFFVIASLRKAEIADGITASCREAWAYLDGYLKDHQIPDSEKWFSKQLPLVRALFFLLGSAMIAFTTVVFGLVVAIVSIFFDVFILWRTLPLEQGFEKVIDSIASFFDELGDSLRISYILVPVARAFVSLIKLVAAIDVSALVSAVNVTCEGSLAPLELLTDFIILGAVVVIVVSEFSFLSITRKRLYEAYFQYAGNLPDRASPDSKVVTLCSVTFLCREGLQMLLGVLLLQTPWFYRTFLRYLMTFVVVSKFFPGHAQTEVCSSLDPKNFDQFFAVSASIIAYLSVCPSAYIIARVCTPASGRAGPVSALFRRLVGDAFDFWQHRDNTNVRETTTLFRLVPDLIPACLERWAVNSVRKWLKKDANFNANINKGEENACGCICVPYSTVSHTDTRTRDLPPYHQVVSDCVSEVWGRLGCCPKSPLRVCLLPLAAFGPLQLFTWRSLGNLFRVADRLCAFVEVSLGVWNDATVEAYGLHAKAGSEPGGYCNIGSIEGVRDEDWDWPEDYRSILSVIFSTRALLFIAVGSSPLAIFSLNCSNAPLFVLSDADLGIHGAEGNAENASPSAQFAKRVPLTLLFRDESKEETTLERGESFSDALLLRVSSRRRRARPLHPLLNHLEIWNYKLTQGRAVSFLQGAFMFLVTIYLFLAAGSPPPARQLTAMLAVTAVVMVLFLTLSAFKWVAAFGRFVHLKKNDFAPVLTPLKKALEGVEFFGCTLPMILWKLAEGCLTLVLGKEGVDEVFSSDDFDAAPWDDGEAGSVVELGEIDNTSIILTEAPGGDHAGVGLVHRAAGQLSTEADPQQLTLRTQTAINAGNFSSSASAISLINPKLLPMPIQTGSSSFTERVLTSLGGSPRTPTPLSASDEYSSKPSTPYSRISSKEHEDDGFGSEDPETGGEAPRPTANERIRQKMIQLQAARLSLRGETDGKRG